MIMEKFEEPSKIESSGEKKEELLEKEKKGIAGKIIEEATKEFREIVRADLRDTSDEEPVSEYRDLGRIFFEKRGKFSEKIWQELYGTEKIKEEIREIKKEIEDGKRWLKEEREKIETLENKINQAKYYSDEWKGLMQQEIEISNRIGSLEGKIKDNEEGLLKLNNKLPEVEEKSKKIREFIPNIVKQAETSYREWYQKAEKESDWSKYEDWQLSLKGHFDRIIDWDNIKFENTIEIENKIKSEEERKLKSEE